MFVNLLVIISFVSFNATKEFHSHLMLTVDFNFIGSRNGNEGCRIIICTKLELGWASS